MKSRQGKRSSTDSEITVEIARNAFLDSLQVQGMTRRRAEKILRWVNRQNKEYETFVREAKAERGE